MFDLVYKSITCSSTQTHFITRFNKITWRCF